MSKLQTATEIVKANPEKSVALQAIMTALEVSKANAFVYWTKASKALGTTPTVKATIVKEVVASRRKTNPVTGTTPNQAKKKIDEIDAVIASMKAAGVNASPFPVA
jgi:hypothetical protein